MKEINVPRNEKLVRGLISRYKDVRNASIGLQREAQKARTGVNFSYRLEPPLDEVNLDVRNIATEHRLFGAATKSQCTYTARSLGELDHATSGFARIKEIASPIRKGIRRLVKAVNRLQKALHDLEKEAVAFDYTRRDRKSRDRIESVLANLANTQIRRPDMEHLEALFAGLPDLYELDWERLDNNRRLAKIYLLNQVVFQEWRVSYRSDSPGRPLQSYGLSSDLPDWNEIYRIIEDIGAPKVFYIAALIPRWRIVWRLVM